MTHKNTRFPGPHSALNLPSIFSPMRSFILSAVTAIALASNSGGQVPVGPNSIKMGKVQPAVVKTPEFQLSSGPQKRTGKSRDWLEIEVDFDTTAELIPELTFKYTILIEKKLLDGEVTHVSIAKGKEHYSVVYVSPSVLERLTGGKALTAGSIENVWVEVSSQGQKLAPIISHRPGAVPNAPHLTGMVLTKDQTPFAPLFYDRYEAIKPTR